MAVESIQCAQLTVACHSSAYHLLCLTISQVAQQLCQVANCLTVALQIWGRSRASPLTFGCSARPCNTAVPGIPVQGFCTQVEGRVPL